MKFRNFTFKQMSVTIKVNFQRETEESLESSLEAAKFGTSDSPFGVDLVLLV